MKSRLQKNHPEWYEEKVTQNLELSEDSQVEHIEDSVIEMTKPRQAKVNRFLTIGIVIEVILLVIVLYIAFKK